MEEKRRQQGGKIRAGCKTIAFKFLIRPSCRAVEVSELPWPRAATCSEASPLTGTYDENPWPADVHRVQSESECRRTMPAGFPALDAFRCRVNAGIVAQMLPLGLWCVAARISVLQCRNTSEVFREDRPSQESSSSGRRPMMCPSS